MRTRWLTAVLLLCLLVAGCTGDGGGDGDGSDDGRVTLRFQSLAWQEESVAVNKELVKEWTAFNDRPVERVARAFGEIRSGGTFDLTTLSVAQRQLRNLVLTSSPCR